MAEAVDAPFDRPDAGFNSLEGWTWVGCYGGYYLQADLLAEFEHGFFTRQWQGRGPEVLAGYVSAGVSVHRPKQIHSALVLPASQAGAEPWPEADGLVSDGGGQSLWVPFTRWVFDQPSDALRRAPYEPRTVRLADGREIEVLFSRQRLPLGTQVALDEFVLTTHAGGFTGEMGSIRDYTSRLRFRDAGESAWSETLDTAMNSPAQHEGLWYFQAQWDPPDNRPPEGGVMSAGLNYTVLGVGNREGVYIQLLGCVIAVAGMLYAFYVKPVIKRRNRLAWYAGIFDGQSWPDWFGAIAGPRRRSRQHLGQCAHAYWVHPICRPQPQRGHPQMDGGQLRPPDVLTRRGLARS